MCIGVWRIITNNIPSYKIMKVKRARLTNSRESLWRFSSPLMKYHAYICLEHFRQFVPVYSPGYIRKYFARNLNSVCRIITRDCTHKLSDVIYFCATLLIHALIEVTRCQSKSCAQSATAVEFKIHQVYLPGVFKQQYTTDKCF